MQGTLGGKQARDERNNAHPVSLNLTLPPAKATTGGFHILGYDHTWSDDASNGSKMRTTKPKSVPLAMKEPRENLRTHFGFSDTKNSLLDVGLRGLN